MTSQTIKSLTWLCGQYFNNVFITNTLNLNDSYIITLQSKAGDILETSNGLKARKFILENR